MTVKNNKLSTLSAGGNRSGKGKANDKFTQPRQGRANYKKAMTVVQAKKAFLDALKDGYSVTGAARKVERNRQVVYQWRQTDPQFDKAWDDAWESRGDWYEDRNRDQALQGNMAAILNGLRMHRRIVDRQEITGDKGAPLLNPSQIPASTIAEALGILENMSKNGHSDSPISSDS